MCDETTTGSSEIRHAGRGAEGGAGSESPLQARAAFLAIWDWESVVRHNRGVCKRGRAQHGQNPEGYAAVEAAWRQKQSEILTLQQTLDFLKSCHRRTPFLFFNGNTFADIARNVADVIFAELPQIRRRELTSAVALSQVGRVSPLTAHFFGFMRRPARDCPALPAMGRFALAKARSFPGRARQSLDRPLLRLHATAVKGLPSPTSNGTLRACESSSFPGRARQSLDHPLLQLHATAGKGLPSPTSNGTLRACESSFFPR